MRDFVSPDRLVPLALSKSIWASSMQVQSVVGKSGELDLFPLLGEDDVIEFGSSGLAFKDKSLLRAVRKGWAIPSLFKFLSSPISATRALRLLVSASRIHRAKENSRFHAEVILRGGLEATISYLNHHPSCRKLFSDCDLAEIGFGFSDVGAKFRASRDRDLIWRVLEYKEGENLHAILLFCDNDAAIASARGCLSSLIAAGSGKILLAGRIPLLDKFGYASKIAQLEIPQPFQ